MSEEQRPIPWTPGAARAALIGTLSMLALYAIGLGLAWWGDGRASALFAPATWRSGLRTAYGTTAFFATFGFAGFIIGIASAERPYRNAFWSLAICLVPLILIGAEGLVCITISLPLLLPELLIGAWLGFTLRKRAHLSQRRRLGLMALAFLASAAWELHAGRHNDPANHPLHRVETALAIQASPERLFAALQDIEVTRPPPAWLRSGLPVPRRMRVIKPGLGGQIRFDYADMRVDAEITGWLAGRLLAFRPTRYDIHDPPFFRTRLGSIPGLKQDPVTDWMTFEELSYQLAPLPSGGTLLTRTSIFRRHLFPDLYFGWLEPLVIRLGQEHLVRAISDRIADQGLIVERAGASEAVRIR